MSWFGKMIGGTIGFALGGPIGAIAGAVFGHAFVDKREEEYFGGIPGKKRDKILSYNEQAQLIFFTGTFSMLAKICKIDGQVSQKEINAVENFMKYKLQLDEAGQNTAKSIFREAINSHDSFESLALQFYSVFKNQPNIMELVLDVLLQVAMADGGLSVGEESMIQSAAQIFYISQADYQRLKSKYVSTAEPYCAVLKLDKSASNEEIKKQYRILVNEYHPDKIQAKGLPEEFVKFAHDKFIEIQNAYEHIKRQRGF